MKKMVLWVWILTGINLIHADTWTQTDWSGGPGQWFWNDTTMFWITEDFPIDWDIDTGNLLLKFPIWFEIFLSPQTSEIYTFAKVNDSTVLAGSKNGYIYKFFNRFQPPETIAQLPGDVRTIIRADGAFYAGCSNSPFVWWSVDNGDTWDSLYLGPSVTDVWSLLNIGTRLIAGVSEPYPSIYFSDDGGNYWWGIPLPWYYPEGEITSLLKTSSGLTFAGTYETDGVNEFGGIYISPDSGIYWSPPVILPGVRAVYSLAEDQDGVIYAGTYPFGDVFKSEDAGTTWVNTSNLEGALSVYSLLVTGDNTLYAGTGINGDIFKSEDKGQTWEPTTYSNFEFRPSRVFALYSAPHRFLLAGTDTSQFGVSLFTADQSWGKLISSVYQTSSAEWGTVTWNATLNSGAVRVKLRTDTLPDMSTAMEWNMCEDAINGQDISSLNSVTDGHPYIQYFIYLSAYTGSVMGDFPVFHEISINYTVSVQEATRETFTNPEFSVHYADRGIKILYQIPKTSRVKLGVFDVTGRHIRNLKNKVQSTGKYELFLKDIFFPGNYFILFKTSEYRKVKKITVIE